MSLDVYLEDNKCSCCGRGDQVYDANITHNLNQMAMAAGIYDIVWRPEENGIDKAKQLIEPLTKAIADMKARPELYKRFNSSNRWGSYDNFVPWLERYLEACIEHPESSVSVSR